MHLNINSIICKFCDIDKLLRKNIFDIVFIQESKLGSTTPNEFLENDLYLMLRRDRAAGGGGLLVYVKKVYKDFIVYEFQDKQYETIQFSLNFKTKGKRKHTFITSYNPHFQMSSDYLLYLEQYIKKTSKKCKSIVLIGDLNQDLLTNNGNNLKFLMESQNFKSYQNKPSHIIKNSQTCIDNVFCNNNELISSTETSSCLFSDHEFVSFALNLTPIKNGPVVVETRTLNQAKLNSIDSALRECPSVRTAIIDSASSEE